MGYQLIRISDLGRTALIDLDQKIGIMRNFISLFFILCAMIASYSRPYHPYPTQDVSADFSKFAKIKDLIDRINIKKFRSMYDIMEEALEAEENIVKIDLTEEAINEERVTEEVPAAEETTVVAKAAADEAEEEEEATTVAAAAAAATEPEATTVLAKAAAEEEEEATTAAAVAAAAAAEPDVSENEIIDEFFVSEETLQAAKKYGYKILLKKINGATVPVGQIKFKFPTFIEVEVVDEVTTAAAPTVEAKIAEATTAAPVAAEETTAAAIAVEETTATAAAIAVEETTAAATVEETTAAALEETTTAVAIIAPRVTAAVIPEITEISTDTVTQGAEQVVEDTEIAVAALEETKIASEVEISEDCSVSLQEFKGLVVDLARKIKDSTPILHEIVTIGKGLKGITDTATLLSAGGQLLKLLEPFLESILPSSEIASCGGPNAMLISMSNVATEVDVVANTIEDEETEKSSILREAATSLQLSAWILSQLQKSVHTFYDKDGICKDNENASTAAILKSLTKAMESYKPMLGMLGPESSVEELEETIKAVNSAVDILETLNPEAAGLPGVSCRASLSEMGESLQNLAVFVSNIENIQV